MKKILALVKVSLSYNMNIFKINTKKQSKFSKVLLPLILVGYIMFIFGYYSVMLYEKLEPLNLGYIILTLFALGVSVLSLIEGVYKSGSLLFNCKDDDLMLSLPIKKRTVLFIRIFKFYVFELLYNSLFLLPSIIVYAVKVNPGWSYYLVSLIALLLLPIIPIVLSCVIGFIITYLSSHFKGKNIVQTIFSMLFLLGILFFYYNINNFITDILGMATSINDIIIKLYYPVGAYISMVNDFNVMSLVLYVLIHVVFVIVTLFVLSKIYFNINSNSKRVISDKKSSKNYVIKSSSPRNAFVKKELNKFLSTPVFITNAGFGLVLFILACIFIVIKFDFIASTLSSLDNGLSVDVIKNQLPVYVLGLICFGSFMTSITSSMISLEGKSFNILKSLPLKPIQIAWYKVLTALVVMVPCILIGDIILFIKFKFNFISMILILVASVLFPLVTELIGIIVNLKYPKVDASNDTEIVKQSMSSFVSTLIGMGLLGISVVALFSLLGSGLNNNLIILIFIGVYGFFCLGLWLILNKICDKYFNNINV